MRLGVMGCSFMLFGFAAAGLAAPAQTGGEDSTLFEFRMPQTVRYKFAEGSSGLAAVAQDAAWLSARRVGSSVEVEFGSRVVVQTHAGVASAAWPLESTFPVTRVLGSGFFILQAPNARAAAQEAARLAALPGVRISYPVVRRNLRLHGPYASRPNDTYFDRQWNLENRSTNGASHALDLNTRAAWSFTRGEGVTIAIADDGVELSHPELVARTENHLHFNFGTGSTDGGPISPSDNHGTAVAGLAAAEWNNQRGMAGVAPAAQIASWKIFQGSTLTATDEQLMDMFQYRSDVVGVQNHSWGNSTVEQIAPTPLEGMGVSNAVVFGRQGRGVIMVRAAGNGRDQLSDANDDAYASDPQAIAVAAVRRDGRVASYSTPGACVLVAAPGGDDDADLLTTDRQGARGFNTGSYVDDFADYAVSTHGTSFSAPQISGLAALLLSANPNLTYRDVQLILILAARHYNPVEADLVSNGAGLKVSHNVGFGIPDAGYAVDLARSWINRPAMSELSLAASTALPIPDDAMRLVVTGSAPVPPAIASIPGTPGQGAHADEPTLSVPLVDIGLASPPVTADLEGKGALIQRGTTYFIEKIEAAAAAGAVFAVIYNNVGTTERLIMGGTHEARIPAVLIGREAGEALRAQVATDPSLRAQLVLSPARRLFAVTNTIVCEHASLRVSTTHTQRGDLRITLTSPAGTRSVLQRVNSDASAGPSDWTYHSVHHFLESSRGVWTVEISDEQPLNVGTVSELELVLRGVGVVDSDGDGLDDSWEESRLGDLTSGPREDPDGDGYANVLEQVLHTDPASNDIPFVVDISPWDDTYLRLSWPGVEDQTYQLLAGPSPSTAQAVDFGLPGQFPVTERFVRRSEANHRFFRVRSAAPSARQ